MATLHIGSYVTTALLNVPRGITFPAPPASLYVALYTTMPTKSDGTGAVEVSGGAYTREAIASNTSNWAAPALQGDNVTELISLVNALPWAQATANWGTVVGLGLYDASSGGNLWFYGSLTSSVIVTTGATFSINAGQLTAQAA